MLFCDSAAAHMLAFSMPSITAAALDGSPLRKRNIISRRYYFRSFSPYAYHHLRFLYRRIYYRR